MTWKEAYDELLDSALVRIERLRASVAKRDRLLSTGCGIKLTAEEYTWWDGTGWGSYHKAKRYATHDDAVAALAGTDGRGCCIAGFPSIVEVPHPLDAEVARLREQARLSHENREARIAELESRIEIDTKEAVDAHVVLRYNDKKIAELERFLENSERNYRHVIGERDAARCQIAELEEEVRRLRETISLCSGSCRTDL